MLSQEILRSIEKRSFSELIQTEQCGNAVLFETLCQQSVLHKAGSDGPKKGRSRRRTRESWRSRRTWNRKGRSSHQTSTPRSRTHSHTKRLFVSKRCPQKESRCECPFLCRSIACNRILAAADRRSKARNPSQLDHARPSFRLCPLGSGRSNARQAALNLHKDPRTRPRSRPSCRWRSTSRWSRWRRSTPSSKSRTRSQGEIRTASNTCKRSTDRKHLSIGQGRSCSSCCSRSCATGRFQ